MANVTKKAQYWTGVLYPENMLEDWKECIGDVLQLPYCYCVHDKDELEDGTEERKEHVHIIICFPNPTTYNNALNVFQRLSAPDKQAINTCQYIINIRFMYDYLIHNTEDCKKKKKYLYSVTERVSGNNFDIGAYEQIGIKEKKQMAYELLQYIRSENICNYADFYDMILSKFSLDYLDLLFSYSRVFSDLINGNYQKHNQNKKTEKDISE